MIDRIGFALTGTGLLCLYCGICLLRLSTSRWELPIVLVGAVVILLVFSALTILLIRIGAL